MERAADPRRIFFCCYSLSKISTLQCYTLSVCVMCMCKKEKGKVVMKKGQHLLHKVVKKLEMSVVSTCLECISMRRGNGYVDLSVAHE